jgi:hypothetical protein
MFFRRQPAGRLSPEEAMAERLLAGRGAGPGAPSGHQALERVLAAAARPATRRELSGEAAAVTAFLLAARANGAHGSQARHGRHGRRPAARRPAYKLPALTAALMMMMFLAIGGTAAAGALPGPLQRLAHSTFGAPAPDTGRPPAVGNPRDGHGTFSPAATASRPATTPGGTGSTAPAAGDGNAQGQQEPTSAPTAASGTTKTSGGQGDGNGQGNGNSQSGGTGHGKKSGQGIRPTPGPDPTPTPASPTGSNQTGNATGQG